MTGPFAWLRILYRLPWLLLHLLVGTPFTVLCQGRAGRAIPCGTRRLDEVVLTWWARTVCRIFGLRRQISGSIQPGPVLVAANHISFLDIQLLHSVASMGFVAKAEIGNWPLLGRMAEAGGTVFHRRGSHDSASDVAAQMQDRLTAGERVAIFPEGGILAGTGVKRFHARLFGAAIETGAPVQPAMLRYIRDGARYDDITFRPGEHFLANFLRLLIQPPCVAELQLLPLIDSRGRQRRELAEAAESAVRTAYEANPGSGLGKG